jgi:hypothetical protein
VKVARGATYAALAVLVVACGGFLGIPDDELPPASADGGDDGAAPDAKTSDSSIGPHDAGEAGQQDADAAPLACLPVGGACDGGMGCCLSTQSEGINVCRSNGVCGACSGNTGFCVTKADCCANLECEPRVNDTAICCKPQLAKCLSDKDCCSASCGMSGEPGEIVKTCQ